MFRENEAAFDDMLADGEDAYNDSLYPEEDDFDDFDEQEDDLGLEQLSGLAYYRMLSEQQYSDNDTDGYVQDYDQHQEY